MRSIRILFFIFILQFDSFCQLPAAKHNTDVALRLFVPVQYTPQDLFTGFGFSTSIRPKIFFQSSFLASINRTFFQDRYYPKLTYQITYSVFEGKLIQVFGGVRGTNDALHVNKSVKRGYQFAQEVLPAVGISIGARWRGALTGGVGQRFQWYGNALTNRYDVLHRWNYFIEVSLSYAIR